jgi:hypothetical protein
MRHGNAFRFQPRPASFPGNQLPMNNTAGETTT